MSDYWKQYEGKTVPLKELLKWLSDEHTHVTDGEGDLLEGWNFAVVNSMALHRWAIGQAESVDYEYAIQRYHNYSGDWVTTDKYDEGLLSDYWGTLGEREQNMTYLLRGFPNTKYRIIKRRKAGGIEEL